MNAYIIFYVEIIWGTPLYSLLVKGFYDYFGTIEHSEMYF